MKTVSAALNAPVIPVMLYKTTVNVVMSMNVLLEKMIAAVILFVRTIQVHLFVIVHPDTLVQDVIWKTLKRMSVMLELHVQTLTNALLESCDLSVELVKKMKTVWTTLVVTVALARMASTVEKMTFVTTSMSAMVITVVERAHIVSTKSPRN